MKQKTHWLKKKNWTLLNAGHYSCKFHVVAVKRAFPTPEPVGGTTSTTDLHHANSWPLATVRRKPLCFAVTFLNYPDFLFLIILEQRPNFVPVCSLTWCHTYQDAFWRLEVARFFAFHRQKYWTLIFVLSTFTLWTFEQRNFLFATFRRSKPLKVLSTKISGLLMFFKHMCNCRESPDFPSLFLSFHFQKHPPRGHHLGKYE